MWQGLQSITDYKKKTSPVTDQDVLLPGRLNNFFAPFEDNTVPLIRPATKTCWLSLSFTAANVSKTFKRVNAHKAAGPDGIPASSSEHAQTSCIYCLHFTLAIDVVLPSPQQPQIGYFMWVGVGRQTRASHIS